ncbi:alpha-galactosidase D [Mycetocola tolaasinivorans]|nr:CBM35 domain-containing protein [Mycetocola tolaasinivorans]
MKQRLARLLGVGAAAIALTLGGTLIPAAPPAEAATLFDPGNNMAKTPPLGWNSYNIFGGTFFPQYNDCSLPSCIPLNETRVKEVAQAMIDNGLRDKGYRSINIDDRWQDPRVPRGTDGKLRWDDRRFPSGMPALATWLHDRGFKMGLYVLPNDRPCGGEEGPTNKPGWPSGLPETSSMGHEYVDAQTFADWGADYLKFDWCGVNETHTNGQAGTVFKKWNQAIQASGRNIMVAASTWGWESEQNWGPQYAHTWRIDGDVGPNWNDVLKTLDKGSTATLRSASGPTKGWNDFDTLQVGNPGLTPAENRTHFMMWAMSNSPLMLGNDVRSMTPDIASLIGNTEILSVNQDTLGEQAWLAKNTGGLQVWARSLQDGSKAVALVNRTGSTANITANFSDIFLGSTSGAVRDLFAQADRGVSTTGYTASVASHDTVILRVIPARSTEAESGTLAGGAAIQNCATCSGGKNVGYVGNNSGTATVTVNAASAGNHALTVFFNSGDDRSVQVSVNGAAPITLSALNSGGWSQVGQRSIPVTLNSGNNTIRFSNGAGQWAPDLDRVTIHRTP